MHHPFKMIVAIVPFALLAACGGGSDLEDRLDVADPAVRFVHASPLAPSVTLYRNTVAQADATNVSYLYESNYFDVDMGAATWSVKTSTGNVSLGSQVIDPTRGNKYTIVALADPSVPDSIYVIDDPYNKSLTSQSAHVRVMNASFNAANIDVYMNAVGTAIAGVSPLIAGTAYKTSGPRSGDDAIDIPGGTYKLRITTAGTKTVLFSGTVAVGNNQDLLLLTAPDNSIPVGLKALLVVDGTANRAATEIPADPS